MWRHQQSTHFNSTILHGTYCIATSWAICSTWIIHAMQGFWCGSAMAMAWENIAYMCIVTVPNLSYLFALHTYIHMLSFADLWLLTRWPHKAGMKEEPHHSTTKGRQVALRDGLVAATPSNSQYVPNFSTACTVYKKEIQINHTRLVVSNASSQGCCSVSWCQLRVVCPNALATFWTIPALVWACTL